MNEKQRKLSAGIVIMLLFGFIVGILLGVIGFKTYITEHTSKCEETLEDCAGLLENCWIEVRGLNSPMPDLNYTRVNDLVNTE